MRESERVRERERESHKVVSGLHRSLSSEASEAECDVGRENSLVSHSVPQLRQLSLAGVSEVRKDEAVTVWGQFCPVWFRSPPGMWYGVCGMRYGVCGMKHRV